MPIFVFMYIGQGLHPATHHAEIPSMTFHMHLVGVSSYAEAEQTARKLAMNPDLRAIELCPSFGTCGVARVKKAAGPKINVGVVRFDSNPNMSHRSGDDLF